MGGGDGGGAGAGGVAGWCSAHGGARGMRWCLVLLRGGAVRTVVVPGASASVGADLALVLVLGLVWIPVDSLPHCARMF